MKTVNTVSQIAASYDRVSELLLTTKTLASVSAKRIRFRGTSVWPVRWDKWPTEEYIDIQPSYLGLPHGHHYVRVDDICSSKNDGGHKLVISTDEYGGIFKKWKHTMKLISLGYNLCQLTDTVQFDAGMLTPLAYWIVRDQYRSRHAQWHKIVATA